MVNTHLPFVNTHLPGARYVFAIMAKTKGKKPGPRKGSTKPLKRPLDDEFPARLLEAMGRRGFVRNDDTTMNAELARAAHCTHAAIGQYLSGTKKTMDLFLLLDLCDALWVSPYWLVKKEGTINDVQKNKIPMEEFRKKRTA